MSLHEQSKKNLSPFLRALAIAVQMLPASMTPLPMPACLPPAATMPPPGGGETLRGEDEQFLLRAFHSFAEAAESLERSYGELRCEVARLRGDLEQSNAGLEKSLEENRRMREHLDRIVEGLPCGVLVAKSDGAISLINPEGQRLLGSIQRRESVTAFESLSSAPGELRNLFERARSEPGEQEQLFRGGSTRGIWLAVRHAAVQDAEVFILRDVSEVRRLVEEKDKLRREQALAEMSAILAHEIRNPLGSLELFAGLLAGAPLSAGCRQWVEQIQAGLRMLAATVNNVLHFHSLPAPECAPTDLGQLLDWAGGFLLPMARQARVELCLRNHLYGVCTQATGFHLPGYSSHPG